jgi:hypothetical protein
MRYRIGGSRGHYVPGPDEPTAIDTGAAVVTDRRIVFVGSKAAREWLWPKVIGVHHEDGAPWTAIAVSNRQKVSGIAYDDATAGAVRFRIDLAQAVASGDADAFTTELEGERAEHAAHRPGAALPPPAPPVGTTTSSP